MSPEQVRGQAVDPRSDIFSFGILLHDLLSGERPSVADSSPEVMSAILRDDPRPLPARVPPPVARIISQCLAKEPRQRWQSAQDLATSLRWAADLLSSSLDPVAALKPSRERWFWIAAVDRAKADERRVRRWRFAQPGSPLSLPDLTAPVDLSVHNSMDHAHAGPVSG
jgi:serine/threonine protein kinase